MGSGQTDSIRMAVRVDSPLEDRGCVRCTTRHVDFRLSIYLRLRYKEAFEYVIHEKRAFTCPAKTGCLDQSIASSFLDHAEDAQ
jgi:hypothetical protein